MMLNICFVFTGQGCSMEQMSSIRDQQESLAKLHFEIGARQDPSAPLSEEGILYFKLKILQESGRNKSILKKKS